MQNVLSPDSVTAGVLESIAANGANPPSARQLATLLHVAPATLYGTVRSLDEAYSRARSALAERATRAVVAAVVRSDSAPLAELLNSLGPQAVFLTDPRWPLGSNPMIEAALSRAGYDSNILRDVLAVIGSLLPREQSVSGTSSADVAHVSADQVSDLISTYMSARAQSEDSSLDALPDGDNEMEQVLGHVHALLDDAGIDERRRMVRFQTARLVASPEPWSFRMLSDVTGLAVSRLHRFGSRVWHLSQAISDLAAGVSLLESADASPARLVHRKTRFLLDSGAADALGEVYHSIRMAGGESVVEPPLPDAVTAVVVAHRVAKVDVAESSQLATELHQLLAA